MTREKPAPAANAWQFSLASLMGFTLFCAIAFAYWHYAAEIFRRLPVKAMEMIQTELTE